jgi:hypothetical protein
MDKEQKKRTDILDKIEDTSGSLGLGDRWAANGRIRNDTKYGICGSCKHSRATKTKYTTKMWRCEELNFKLSTEDPITDCSSYDKVGSMTLQQMVSIAYIIESDKSKKVGF